MYILGIHTGHDASACVFKNNKLVAFCKEERLNRVKNDGGFFSLQSINEVLRIAGISLNDIDAVALTRLYLPVKVYKTSALNLKNIRKKFFSKDIDLSLVRYLSRNKTLDVEKVIDLSALKKALGVDQSTEVFFSNHHRAHALSAFKYVDWEKDTLIVTCDGGGDYAQYSAYHYDGKKLNVLLGGEETLIEKRQNTGASIGLAYAYATELCGFKRNRHEGKLTGLAAFGNPSAAKAIIEAFTIGDDGSVSTALDGQEGLEAYLDKVFSNMSNEDIAASIQKATEDIVSAWVKKLLEITGAKYIAMSGGVFSNVKLNQCIAEIDGVEEVFIFPAMADEGLSVGACVDYLVDKNGINLLERKRLNNVYLGWAYDSASIIEAAIKDGMNVDKGNAAD